MTSYSCGEVSDRLSGELHVLVLTRVRVCARRKTSASRCKSRWSLGDHWRLTPLESGRSSCIRAGLEASDWSWRWKMTYQDVPPAIVDASSLVRV